MSKFSRGWMLPSGHGNPVSPIPRLMSTYIEALDEPTVAAINEQEQGIQEFWFCYLSCFAPSRVGVKRLGLFSNLAPEVAFLSSRSERLVPRCGVSGKEKRVPVIDCL